MQYATNEEGGEVDLSEEMEHAEKGSCNVSESVPCTIHTFNVLLLQQRIYRLQHNGRSVKKEYMQRALTHLLDIWYLWRKALRDLGGDFLNQGLIFHCLASLHNAEKRLSN
jgi:hypothetical protein